MRRRLVIEEEYGAFYLTSAEGLRVQSATLEGVLRKAAVEKGAAHADGHLEIRSTQDMVEVLDTILGSRSVARAEAA